MSERRGHPIALAGAALAIGVAIALQIARDRWYQPEHRATDDVLYVRSGPALARLALEFDAMAADVYWIRAIQHYGGTRRSTDRVRRYDLLYPLLDLTTSLDPYFTIAYRFGAIFLSEQYPGGPGRPDQAIALLEKGIAAQPGKWQYYHDIAFVQYWHLQNPGKAAEWFERSASQPDAPNWIRPLAAAMLTEHDRGSARIVWQQILQSDQQWLRRTAQRSLLQLDAMDQIDELTAIVGRMPPPAGERLTWDSFVRRRVLPGVPVDPARNPYVLDPDTGQVRLSERSPLYPLPDLRRLPR
ncbi:MAG TPA: hypothetical protein VHI99_29505 [Vicinamibacterales bacterium]|nr:hypothetical protein [Vicinamibacterales bacterium]